MELANATNHLPQFCKKHKEKAQRTSQGKKLKKEKPKSTPVRMNSIESLIAAILHLFGWQMETIFRKLRSLFI